MAVAGDAVPVVASDRQHHALHQPPVLAWHGRHHAGVVVGARAHLVQRVGVGEAVVGEEACRAVAAKGRVGSAGHLRHIPVGAADPEAAVACSRAPAFAQPMREADVIGVHVGADHAQHRQALQFVGEDLIPMRARGRVGDAAVHDGPAGGAVLHIAQQPQVDVVQRKGQAHAQPSHAGCQFQRAAGLGQGAAQGIVQRTLKPGSFLGMGHGLYIRGSR